MDFLKKAALKQVMGGSSKTGSSSDPAAASAAAAPKKEDHLDKAIDLVQEHVLKQGSQKNESAAEQAKDEKIKGGIKSLYKFATGKDLK